MTEPYIGEIQLFGFPYAPYQWATCAGQLVPIRQNTALFSLLGISYGGDGVNTFALPDFRGNAANNKGQGPGLTPRVIGETLGTPTVTVLSPEMPMHTHTAQIYMARGTTARVNTPANGAAPSNCTMAHGFTNDTVPPDTMFNPMMLYPTGGTQPHPNQQPYLAVNYSIALQGVFPSFN